MKIILNVLGISNTIDINPEKETFNSIIIKYLSFNNNDISSFEYLNNEITNFNDHLCKHNMKENSIITIKIKNNSLNSSISNQNIFKIRPKISKSKIAFSEKRSNGFISHTRGIRQIYFNTVVNKNDLKEFLYERVHENNLLKGIPFELAIEQSKFLSLLKCDICNGIFNNPKSCNSCQKNFCQECIKDLEFCINCKKSIKVQEIDKTLKDILQIIDFKCKYNDRGCDKIIKYNEYNSHISNCDYGIFICKTENCNFKGTKEKIIKHSENCGLLLIKCKYCNKQYEKIILRNHEEKCGNRLSLCEYCKKCIQLKSFEKHKNNCIMKIIICNKCGANFYKKDLEEHTDVICLKEQIKNVKNELNIEKEKRVIIENQINELKIKFKNIEEKL